MDQDGLIAERDPNAAPVGSMWPPELSEVSRAPAAGCRMCAMRTSRAPWDTPIVSTDHFVVVASKGAFLPGWLMIVPKTHVLSMAELGDDHSDELEELIASVRELQQPVFGSPTMFEHGASVPGTSFGCGIDHAHLHLVPLPPTMDLRALAEAELGEGFLPEPAQFGDPYLRLRAPGTSGWLWQSPTRSIPRQFFRQLIWVASNRPSSSYDYDESPCEDVVRRTVRTLVGR